jgi:hypothetical protein
MPQTLGKPTPRAKGLQRTMTSAQAAMVEPASRRVVKVIGDAKN